MTVHSFGDRRIYYNNFAGHLLNRYNPNMLHPDLPLRWSDGDWRRYLDMVRSFGFNVFEFWLVPRLFCREALDSDLGAEFARQINTACDHAHGLGMQVQMLCGLATVGTDWHTYCPNDPDEWAEVRRLWDQWTRRLPGVDILDIFPGDPGACSRNGCTAETFIDKACEVGELARGNLPEVEVQLNTWGPPIFGWGNIEGPAGWRGEFIADKQHTAWTFDKARADRAMAHLIRRLPDFPDDTSVAINLGFNPDAEPVDDQDARPWAREIAKHARILTWDFSLTEGENAILPHYRVHRLFEQRRRERAAAPYSGGICYTMTPMLNQLSLYEAAVSFTDPDADPDRVAGDFCARVFGEPGRALVEYLPLLEPVHDWGNYVGVDPRSAEYHRRVTELRELLESLTPTAADDASLFPSPEAYRRELLFFAELFEALSGPSPDDERLAQRYWDHVYSIYDHLPRHVDERPGQATRKLIATFRGDTATAGEPAPGRWV